LFISISQVIGCEDHLRNDLDCGECKTITRNQAVARIAKHTASQHLGGHDVGSRDVISHVTIW